MEFLYEFWKYNGRWAIIWREFGGNELKMNIFEILWTTKFQKSEEIKNVHPFLNDFFVYPKICKFKRKFCPKMLRMIFDFFWFYFRVQFHFIPPSKFAFCYLPNSPTNFNLAIFDCFFGQNDAKKLENLCGR